MLNPAICEASTRHDHFLPYSREGESKGVGLQPGSSFVGRTKYRRNCVMSPPHNLYHSMISCGLTPTQTWISPTECATLSASLRWQTAPFRHKTSETVEALKDDWMELRKRVAYRYMALCLKIKSNYTLYLVSNSPDDAMRTSYLENVAANREISETFLHRPDKPDA